MSADKTSFFKLLDRVITFRLFAFLLVQLVAWRLAEARIIADTVWGWVSMGAITAYFGSEFGKDFTNLRNKE